MVRWYIGATTTFLLSIFFIYGTIYFYKEKNKLKKSLCALLLIGFFLCIMGASCNLIVISSNGYKMPVLGGAVGEYHCNLTEKSRLVFLADIFYLNMRKHTLFYSIGDTLMFIGLFVCMLFYWSVIIFNKWQKRRQKILDKKSVEQMAERLVKKQ